MHHYITMDMARTLCIRKMLFPFVKMILEVAIVAMGVVVLNNVVAIGAAKFRAI